MGRDYRVTPSEAKSRVVGDACTVDEDPVTCRHESQTPVAPAGASTVIVAAGVATGTQPPGSFDGHWVLTSISPQRPAYDQFWLGTEARVTQTETTLVITAHHPAPTTSSSMSKGSRSSA